jgi:hypothetical protein
MSLFALTDFVLRFFSSFDEIAGFIFAFGGWMKIFYIYAGLDLFGTY